MSCAWHPSSQTRRAPEILVVVADALLLALFLPALLCTSPSLVPVPTAAAATTTTPSTASSSSSSSPTSSPSSSAASTPLSLGDALALRETQMRAVRSAVEAKFNELSAAEPGRCPVADQCDSGLTSLLSADAKYDGVCTNRTFAAYYLNAESADARDVRHSVCALAAAEAEWLARYDPSSWHWSYLGEHAHGLLNNHPAINLPQAEANRAYPDKCSTSRMQPCDYSYDPRYRPWYAAGASGPKDVVLVIDKSGSMTDNGRWDLAVEAANAVLDTFQWTDYFGIVLFSSSATVYEPLLAPATAANRVAASAWLDDKSPSGTTNYGAGLEKAFALIEDSREAGASSRCAAAILFLTDGHNSEGPNPQSVVREHTGGSSETSATIFAYSLGTDADIETPRDLACLTGGMFYAVEDAGPLRDTMASYYAYFAAGIDSSVVRWSEPFDDWYGSGELAAAALAVYDRTGDVPALFGVLASDFPMSFLLARANRSEITAELRARSNACPTVSLTDEQIEALRADGFKCSSRSLWWLGLVIPGGILGLALGVGVPVVMYYRRVIHRSVRVHGAPDAHRRRKHPAPSEFGPASNAPNAPWSPHAARTTAAAPSPPPSSSSSSPLPPPPDVPHFPTAFPAPTAPPAFADRPVAPSSSVWERKIDQQSGRVLFVNHATQQTTWDDPSAMYPVGAVAVWERLVDPAAGMRPYFVNVASGLTTWEDPFVAAATTTATATATAPTNPFGTPTLGDA